MPPSIAIHFYKFILILETFCQTPLTLFKIEAFIWVSFWRALKFQFFHWRYWNLTNARESFIKHNSTTFSLLSPSFSEQKIAINRSPRIEYISKSSIEHSKTHSKYWYTWQRPRIVILALNPNTYNQSHQERDSVVSWQQDMYNIFSFTWKTRASWTKPGITGRYFGQSLGTAPRLVTEDHHTLPQAKMWPPWPYFYTWINISVRVGRSRRRKDWSKKSCTARTEADCVLLPTAIKIHNILGSFPHFLQWKQWSMVVVHFLWVYILRIRCIHGNHKHNYSYWPSWPQYKGVAESSCDDASCLWGLEGGKVGNN